MLVIETTVFGDDDRRVIDGEATVKVLEVRSDEEEGKDMTEGKNAVIVTGASRGIGAAIAREIAATVRASSGGLAHVKGIGLSLEDRGITQVSMNIVDYGKNALYRVVELIRMEARRWGVPVLETEVYGMVPAKALLESAAYYLQIADFDPGQVIELAMLDSLDG